MRRMLGAVISLEAGPQRELYQRPKYKEAIDLTKNQLSREERF